MVWAILKACNQRLFYYVISPPSQTLQRPPRVKSIPKKFHDGVDRSIPGVSSDIPETTSKAASATPTRSRGVSFKEPVTSPIEN